MFTITGNYTSAKVMIDEVEASCIAQIHHFVNHPSFTNPVAIMPDTHAGKGSVIGFTMQLTSTVIPNVIGVDIGCGMLSLNIGKTPGLSPEQIDHKIRQRVPFGMAVHDNPVLRMEKEFPWHRATVLAQKFAAAYRDKFGIRITPPQYDMNWFMAKSEMIRAGGVRRFINSLGTLGGGNHFVEIGISESAPDTPGDYWLTIHTGSRNFGKCICDYWQSKAAKSFAREGNDDIAQQIARLRTEITDGKILFDKIKELKALKKKPAVDMKGCEWLEGTAAEGYLFDMLFAQTYAEVNRSLIAGIITGILGITPADSIETVHNFIDFRDFIIRKGAIRAYTGERMILPFNMRDGILICEGKSNPEWNYSAPHGAGRTMSRSQAKKHIDLKRFTDQMQGVFSTSVGIGTLDEAPDAYKPADVIEQAIQPTATITGRISPVHNLKAAEHGDD